MKYIAKSDLNLFLAAAAKAMKVYVPVDNTSRKAWVLLCRALSIIQ